MNPYMRNITRIIDVDLKSFNFTIHQYPNAIGLWKNEQQSLCYYGLIANTNYNWMEIGSFCGGSATILCLTKKRIKQLYIPNDPNIINFNNKVISVDRNFITQDDPMAYMMFMKNMEEFPEMSEQVGCDSRLLPEYYNGDKISLAFIDGWHSFKGALIDFQNVFPWLTKDAIVIFHDVAQQPWTDDFIDKNYEIAKNKYNEFMAEQLPNPNPQQQMYNLDELVSYIMKEYDYELVKNPILDGSKNCMIAIRKIK